MLFPAYKEDNVIIDSVKDFLNQDYPKDLFDVAVISDHMNEETNDLLSKMPIILLQPVFENSSKAKALNFAIDSIVDSGYDTVVIFDADNTADTDFLSRINDVRTKYSAIQTHRTGKNRDTSTAVLDSISEEINNSIFKKGHSNMGLSAGLSGSGMAFDYNWFKFNVAKLSSSGEDKELERLLLKQKIHIAYLDDILVLDEKTRKANTFYNQRRRWIATQIYSLKDSLPELFPSLFKGNFDYTDKIIQWMILPRILLVGLVGIFAFIISFIDFSTAIKWWALLLFFIIALCVAIPGKLYDKKLMKSIITIPKLFLMMVANLFRFKGANKVFIHTEKGTDKQVYRIAIEAQRIFRENKHGMDFVALENILGMQQIDKVNEYFILVAPGKDVCIHETPNFHIKTIKGITYPFWEQIALPLALRKIHPDILHCTSNTAPLFCKTPTIITLHDIIFLEKKRGTSFSFYQNLGWYYRRIVVPIALKKARHIITVSNSEANNIISRLEFGSDKITVIYNGYNPRFKNFGCDNKDGYILFFANTDPKKNTERILKSYTIYAKSVNQPKPLHIIDICPKVYKHLFQKLNLGNFAHLITTSGYIPNSKLPEIYNHSSLFIYASLRESFGIPILESMACGTPVITSNISAMPEIAGDAAFLVDPYNENDIAYGITSILSDEGLYSNLISKGFKRVDSFHLTDTVSQTHKLYLDECKS